MTPQEKVRNWNNRLRNTQWDVEYEDGKYWLYCDGISSQDTSNAAEIEGSVLKIEGMI